MLSNCYQWRVNLNSLSTKPVVQEGDPSGSEPTHLNVVTRAQSEKAAIATQVAAATDSAESVSQSVSDSQMISEVVSGNGMVLVPKATEEKVSKEGTIEDDNM